MSISITANPYSNYMAPAFVGMKEDSMDDNVDTFACGVSVVNVGVAVKRSAAGALTVINGADAALGVGVALHDHLIGYTNGYQPTTAVSVLTRGRVWVALSVGTGVVDGAKCFADATTGKFSTTGTEIAVTNAVFRSAPISLLNVDWSTTTLAACVELHNPNV
jgi:hypothetical protein